MRGFLKTAYPHIFAIIVFISIAAIYFLPSFQGKILNQGDILQYKMVKKEGDDYREKTGQEPLWTNNTFSGMPTFLTALRTPSNLVLKIDQFLKLGLPHPANIMFILSLGFYFLLIIYQVNQRLSIFGALAYAFTSYFMISIEAGHNTKILALAYLPAVIAGITLLVRKKYLLGFIVTALAMALQIRTNHYQITYYMLFILLIFGIFEVINIIKKKDTSHLLKGIGLLMLAFLLAMGTHITKIWCTWEYGKESMRGGKSEMANKSEQDVGGLDRSYALRWSYGISETMTLLIPNFYGGASRGALDKNSETYKLLTKNGVPGSQAKQIVSQVPLYWGGQPFTSGPIYLGAIIIFLFVWGLYILKGPVKWWLVTATILSIFLAWGKNFALLTDFFFYYIPFYNKFRAPAMALVIAEFSVPFLAILGMNRVLAEKLDKQILIKSLKKSVIIVGGICLLFSILPGIIVDFKGDYKETTESTSIDDQYKENWLKNSKNESFANDMLSSLRADRKTILQKDAFRSLIFILLAAGLIWMFIQQKIKQLPLITGIGLLILIDLWVVDKQYLNEDNFISSRKYDQLFNPSKADQLILSDNDPHYRVLDLATNTFNQSTTSYFHKSIGGYHPAKLQRYQDIITYQITPQIKKLGKSGFEAAPVLNMLNMKYIIMNKTAKGVVKNPLAAGNAWFVNEVKWVSNAKDAMLALTDFNPKKTVVINKKYTNYLDDFDFSPTDHSSITLTDYSPNHVNYAVNTDKNQFAVFSEIYYNSNKGWNAYVDGILVDHIQVNYILRGLKINAGTKLVSFKFEPKAYFIGEKISLIASILLIIVVISGLGFEMKKHWSES